MMRIPRRRPDETARPGAMLVLLALMMIALLAFLAMAIDLGVIAATRTELRNAADSAAFAATAQLLDRDELTGSPDQSGEILAARAEAGRLACGNLGWTVPVELAANAANDPGGDVVIGYIADPSNLGSPLSFNAGPAPVAHTPTILHATSALGLNVPFVTPPPPTTPYVSYNSVRVVARRADGHNGPLGLFFGRGLGHDSVELAEASTATYEDNIIGFSVPAGDYDDARGMWASCKMLPFALEVSTFMNVAAGRSWLDMYRYDPDTGASRGTYPHTPPAYADRVRFAYPGLDSYRISKAVLSHRRLSPVIPDALGPDGFGGLLDGVTTYVVNTAYNPNDLFDPEKALDDIFPGDGVKEGLLIPLSLQTQLLGRPMSVGNFGTLFLGTDEHSPLSEFQRQVIWGPNSEDLGAFGDALRLGTHGTVTVSGDTLVFEGLKQALASIRGQPRVIPLFRPKPQPIPGQVLGRRMDYEIVGFGGIIIIEVFDVPSTPALPPVIDPLTGEVITPGIPAGEKTLKVLFQPEFVVDRYALGGGSTLSNGGAKTSRFVYRPLRLAR